MDPHIFLDVADMLVARSSEADWRSAVSRAYYGIFHLARLLLAQCRFTVPRADQAHAYVWLRLSNAGHPDAIRVGSELKVLRGERNWADYELNRAWSQKVANSRVSLARSLADLLDQILASPAVLTQITDAIKNYEQKILKQNTWHP
jgi:uncharacterized protein (UPF0332 family)